MLSSLSQCRAAGIPVYAFDSPELAALHELCREPAIVIGRRADGWMMVGDCWQARKSYPVHSQVYAQHADGRRYVVDHGHGSFTLNTLYAGQVCPEMQDILPH